jgi:hypothetical protein
LDLLHEVVVGIDTEEADAGADLCPGASSSGEFPSS